MNAAQLVAAFVSVDVGAIAPAGANIRVEVRINAAPPCALRGVYPAGGAIVSTLLFSKLMATFQASSSTLVMLVQLTAAVVPVTCNGVTSATPFSWTPKYASTTPAQFVALAIVQV